MIATNPNATDYVDSRYMVAMATVDADFVRDCDLHERAAWIHECRMYQLGRLGLVCGKYWRDAGVAAITAPQRRPRRLGFFSGFSSESRGRHWDRKRK